MAIYGINGMQLDSAFSKNGQDLLSAYGVSGGTVYHKDWDIKVCTYNVGGWYIGNGTNVPTAQKDAFYALQTGIIQSIDADVLLIEEYLANFAADGTSAQTMLQSLYPYVHTETSGTYLGRSVCSKYPITGYTKRYYTTDMSRYYDSCTIAINNVPITFIVTHLHPSNAQSKIEQATELYNFVKTLNTPFIIGGDFNSTLYAPFSATNAAIYDQFIDDGCAIGNGGNFGILDTACNSADWTNDRFAIDNIICSDALTIKSVDTDLTKLTNQAVLVAEKIDHVPFYAYVALN